MRYLLVSLLILVTVHAYADEVDQPAAGKGFVAALAGPGMVTSGGDGTHLIYGGRVGFTVYPDPRGNGTLGLVIATSTDSETVSGVKVDGRTTFLGAEYVARHAFGSGLYFGGRFGMAINNSNLSNGVNSLSATDTVFAAAPVIGYEVALTSGASIMLDLAWLGIYGGTFDYGIDSVEYDGMRLLTIQTGISIEF